MERIKSDLKLLMDNQVAKVKLVDRTFNYDVQRARQIFSFILEHNRSTHFHFEIGAHLLDGATLTLLERVPQDMFQFEIGVQSTAQSTLDAIDRKVSLDKLEKNVRHLVESGRIHLHLDLVAGLPGDTFDSFLAAIDHVIALRPHHLQVEPVKLLPGSPLRDQAKALQVRFDPNPPYTILGSPDLSFDELRHLQEISRLLDLIYNSGCFQRFLGELAKEAGSFAKGLSWLAEEWRQRDLFRYPLNRQAIFNNLVSIAQESARTPAARLVDALAYDYARCERVITNRIPAFFNTRLNTEEQNWVRAVVQEKTEQVRGHGTKVQYFACKFSTIEDSVEESTYLFLYLTQTGKKMQVEEHRFT